MKIALTLNGEVRDLEIGPGETLLSLLRRSGCLSVKYGCGTGDCGTCTAIVNGRVVVSCLLLAAKADGCDVRTMDGWRDDPALQVLAEVFVRQAAVQCGYCIPGMILTARVLLAEHPDPSEAMTRHSLAGILCRCTGYVKPVEAVLEAARCLRATTPVA